MERSVHEQAKPFYVEKKDLFLTRALLKPLTNAGRLFYLLVKTALFCFEME
jgi:hypothetical protein